MSWTPGGQILAPSDTQGVHGIALAPDLHAASRATAGGFGDGVRSRHPQDHSGSEGAAHNPIASCMTAGKHVFTFDAGAGCQVLDASTWRSSPRSRAGQTEFARTIMRAIFREYRKRPGQMVVIDSASSRRISGPAGLQFPSGLASIASIIGCFSVCDGKYGVTKAKAVRRSPRCDRQGTRCGRIR